MITLPGQTRWEKSAVAGGVTVGTLFASLFMACSAAFVFFPPQARDVYNDLDHEVELVPCHQSGWHATPIWLEAAKTKAVRASNACPVFNEDSGKYVGCLLMPKETRTIQVSEARRDVSSETCSYSEDGVNTNYDPEGDDMTLFFVIVIALATSVFMVSTAWPTRSSLCVTA